MAYATPRQIAKTYNAEADLMDTQEKLAKKKEKVLQKYERRVEKAEKPILIDGGKPAFSNMTKEIAGARKERALSKIATKGLKAEQKYERKLKNI